MAGETIKRNSWRTFKKQIYLQIQVIPWIVWLIVFMYFPMYGVILAFKEFQLGSGIFGSPWVGLSQFSMFLDSPEFVQIMRNTLAISLLKLMFGFPAPILFALLLNELAGARFKKWVQTVSYLPYFISWVIVSGMVFQFLSLQDGVINPLLQALGFIREPIMFMGESKYFWAILVVTEIWKSVGWGSIIYIAAISSIDQTMYEAAMVDGASRLKRMLHITLPSIAPTIVILLIFAVSGVLNANFDQVYLMQTPLVTDVGEIIDTYVYKSGILTARYSFATAVDLFKSVIGFVLIISANWVSKKISDNGIW